MAGKQLIRYQPAQAPRPRDRDFLTAQRRLLLSLGAVIVIGAASGLLFKALRDDGGRAVDGDADGTVEVASARDTFPAASLTATLEPPAGQNGNGVGSTIGTGPGGPSPSPSPGSGGPSDPAAAAAAAAAAVEATVDAGVSAAAAPGTPPAGRHEGHAAASRASAGSPDARLATAGRAATMQGAPDGGALAVADGGVHLAEAKVVSEREGDTDRNFVRVARFTPNGGASLEGKVVDADNGRPIAGIVVEARLGRRLVEGATDAAGTFRMPGMLPGTQVVVWIGGTRDPFVSERIEVHVPGEGQVADTGVLKLLKGDEINSSSRSGWVGLFVAPRGGKLIVSAVTPWLPADRASIEVGDALVAIDGRDVTGLGARAVTFLLRGPVGSSVAVAAESAGGSRRKVALERVVR